eukprot:g8982.t1
MAPKTSDTTDRSLFSRARLARFDAHGYTHQRGLRRPLFYKSGYLSCTKCNGLTFIDASALRTMLELRGVVDFGSIRPESLPPCVGVFWYKNEAEEEQLYADYRMLVQRTGFRPPRTVVEQNIREIATRVLEREAELVSRIQARWRGLSVRRYLIVFRRELRRHREVRASMVYRLQRAVRGWSHRKRAARYRSRRAGDKLLTRYLTERSTSNDDNACTEGMSRLRQAYITERQEELTARLMGHCNPKLAGGLRMKAFHESPYGDDVVSELMNHQVWEVMRRKKRLEEKDLNRKKRAEWVRLKQLEDPQLAMYFREEMKARNVYVINKLRSDRRALKNVPSALRDHNRNGGRKYQFPENINEDPLAVLFERHSTDAQALLRRYSKVKT